jgi:hypothetical protein
MTDAAMTRQERESLAKLMRQRERVAKTSAAARSAHLLAEFEAQLDREYSFDEDIVWEQAATAAKAFVAEAQAAIAKRCEELGIPPQFAPGLSVGWYGRGRNAAAGERAEMRRLAKRRIEEIEARARQAIEASSLQAQEQLMLGGLTTDAARKHVESLPSVEGLMPHLDLLQVQASMSRPKALASQSGQGYITEDSL